MSNIEEELGKAEMLLAQEEFDKARKKYGDIIKANPGSAAAYFGKAEASMGVQKVPVEEIMELYKKAWELEPGNVYYLTILGSFCADIGRFNEAEQYYNKATEIDEENASTYFSEFAIAYFMKAPIIMEKFLDDNTKKMIKKKSLVYMLKALDMSPEEARKLLEG
jgi:tetratricopeptide (TPR) repeat protein